MAHDLRFALRMIFSHRWFSAAVVATLALGIGLNTMVFTLINAVLFKPVPVPGGARLVAIRNRNPRRATIRCACRIRTSANTAPSLLPSRPWKQPSTKRACSAKTAILRRHIRWSRLHPASSRCCTPPVLGRGFLPSDDKAGAEPVLVHRLRHLERSLRQLAQRHRPPRARQ